MIALRPFYLLIGRASVFWLTAIGLFLVSITVAGLSQPDERLRMYVDPIFMAAFISPLLAGWLAGAVIQEFQHTSIATCLPDVRRRLASGFLTTGLAVTVVVVGLIALVSSTPQNLPLLFVVGLGAYCLGGVVLDPLSTWITSFNVILALFVFVRSRDAARIAADHPWITVVVCLGVSAACLIRLFARSTFRRKPFRATAPLPGRFSLERSLEYERRRRAQNGPRRSGWRTGYLGNHPWRWVRAAMHEVRERRGWRAVSRAIGRAWGLGALILLYAWVDKGEMGFGEAVARSINDALLRSPYQPQFGEKGGPYPLVALVIATAGLVSALFAPVALNDSMFYPLSRRQRAQVLFRSGLVDGAILLFIVGPCLLAIGQGAGWFVGYEIRFDFMPFFLRPLMITLILIPLAHRGRLRLHEAARRKSEFTLIGIIFGVVGFVLAVALLTFLSPRLFVSPGLELAALVAALLVSQLIYRKSLTAYYRIVDL